MNELEEGIEHALMRAHRYKHTAIARGLHQHALVWAEKWEHFGDPCMAHAKRLQAKYWEKRMFAEHKTRCDQPKLDDIDPFGWGQHGWTKP